jgi:hypothetical protein
MTASSSSACEPLERTSWLPRTAPVRSIVSSITVSPSVAADLAASG